MPETEADTCRVYVLPKLYAACWTDNQIQEQHSFTDGRIVPTAKKIRRLKQKRADYRLRYTRDFPIAVVEAKASYKTAGEGLQQAKEYAEILDLKFAYATNGKEIIEFDFLTGIERKIDAFPSPAELWARLRQGRKLPNEKAADQLLTPCLHQPGKQLRYYQEIAVNRVIEAILMGKRRILLTMLYAAAGRESKHCNETTFYRHLEENHGGNEEAAETLLCRSCVFQHRSQ